MTTYRGSWFAQLPTELGSTILYEWVCDSTAGKVDSAYCSHVERHMILRMLSDSGQMEIKLDYSENRNLFNKLRWMMSRKVECNSFFYSSEPPPQEMSTVESFIKANLACLDEISIVSNDATLMILLSALATSQRALSFLEVGRKKEAQGSDIGTSGSTAYQQFCPVLGCIHAVECIDVGAMGCILSRGRYVCDCVVY